MVTGGKFRYPLRLLKTQRLIPLLVIGIGLLVYSNSLRVGFMFDDVPHIVENPRIRQLWPPWDVLTHTSRPVVMLSLALNHALGGLNPWGYHLFNVGIHILAALALYGVVRLTFLSETLRPRFGPATAGWLAGVVSLIWLVHPLQTESVTYVIQRGESLMGLFHLLTLYCVIRSSGSAGSMWWQVGAVTSCALGMASKPVMVTAPVVVLLYDRVFLAKSWSEVMQRRWRLYAWLAATWLLLPLLLYWQALEPLEVEPMPSMYIPVATLRNRLYVPVGNGVDGVGVRARVGVGVPPP
jgi:4-amino-4-deoxy-L-arabinose transferase-like glycosyltransferase